jgi:hypothetical protein
MDTDSSTQVRKRTSPRVKAISQVLSLLDAHAGQTEIDALRAQIAALMAPKTDNASQGEKRGRGRPKGSKNKPKPGQAITQSLGFTHYFIGEKIDGTRELFSTDELPTVETYGCKYSKVFGAFRYKRSAEYRLNKSDEQLTTENIALPIVFVIH